VPSLLWRAQVRVRGAPTGKGSAKRVKVSFGSGNSLSVSVDGTTLLRCARAARGSDGERRGRGRGVEGPRAYDGAVVAAARVWLTADVTRARALALFHAASRSCLHA